MKNATLISLLSLFLAALALIAAPAAPAHAGPNAFGIRGGFTDDPETAFFGAHAAIHLDGAPRLRLEPSLELGVGDDGEFDFVSLRFNFNFKYMVPLGRQAAVYPIFGPALYYRNFQDCAGDCSDSDVGIDFGGGFAFSGISFDLVLGFSRIPDLTFTIGYTFW